MEYLEAMHQKRPFGVTLLLWMVLSLSVWGVIRFWAALRWWNVLSEFKSSLSPLYLLLTGAGWGTAGIVLLFGLLKLKAWARQAVVSSALIWLLEYWIERIFFQASRSNLPFALTCSITVIGIILILIMLPDTISFFIKSEEHEQPDQKPNSK